MLGLHHALAGPRGQGAEVAPKERRWRRDGGRGKGVHEIRWRQKYKTEEANTISRGGGRGGDDQSSHREGCGGTLRIELVARRGLSCESLSYRLKLGILIR